MRHNTKARRAAEPTRRRRSADSPCRLQAWRSRVSVKRTIRAIANALIGGRESRQGCTLSTFIKFLFYKINLITRYRFNSYFTNKCVSKYTTLNQAKILLYTYDLCFTRKNYRLPTSTENQSLQFLTQEKTVGFPSAWVRAQVSPTALRESRLRASVPWETPCDHTAAPRTSQPNSRDPGGAGVLYNISLADAESF